MRPSSGSTAHVSPVTTSTDTAAELNPRSAAAHFATTNALSSYWQFYWAVAGAQLAQWLPETPSRLLDLSGPEFRSASRAVAAGHDVVTLSPATELTPPRTELTLVNEHIPAARTGRKPGGRRGAVVGDTTFLSGLADRAFDGVIADNRVLSQHIATETSLTEITRVLRPGGRALVCVDSVVLGMALLAEQDRWPELSHAPKADVLLVPWPDGSITRCFTAEQLEELLTEAGLSLEWVKPRTVLSASTVETLMAEDRGVLRHLVDTELRISESEDYVGVHLLASAVRPG